MIVPDGKNIMHKKTFFRLFLRNVAVKKMTKQMFQNFCGHVSQVLLWYSENFNMIAYTLSKLSNVEERSFFFAHTVYAVFKGAINVNSINFKISHSLTMSRCYTVICDMWNISACLDRLQSMIRYCLTVRHWLRSDATK